MISSLALPNVTSRERRVGLTDGRNRESSVGHVEHEESADKKEEDLLIHPIRRAIVIRTRVSGPFQTKNQGGSERTKSGRIELQPLRYASAPSRLTSVQRIQNNRPRKGIAYSRRQANIVPIKTAPTELVIKEDMTMRRS